jgi:hypothetical protein
MPNSSISSSASSAPIICKCRSSTSPEGLRSMPQHVTSRRAEIGVPWQVSVRPGLLYRNRLPDRSDRLRSGYCRRLSARCRRHRRPLVGKAIAAWVADQAFGYSRDQRLTILGPVLTERFARRLTTGASDTGPIEWRRLCNRPFHPVTPARNLVPVIDVGRECHGWDVPGSRGPPSVLPICRICIVPVDPVDQSLSSLAAASRSEGEHAGSDH